MATASKAPLSKRRRTLAGELENLPSLPRADLVSRWEAIYGSPPPHTIKRPLLERAIAWHLQAKQHGGLSPKVKRILAAIAKPQELCNSDSGRGPTPERQKGAVPSRLMPGSRLMREWAGRTYVVDVTADGFRWNGEEHRSLSAIARKITGARWSGPRFFGL